MGFFSKKQCNDLLLDEPVTISEEVWSNAIMNDNYIMKNEVLLSPNEAGDISSKSDALNENSASYILYEVLSSLIEHNSIIKVNDKTPLLIKSYHYEIIPKHVKINGSGQENTYELVNIKTKKTLANISLPYSEILVKDEYLPNNNEKDAYLSPILIIKSLLERITILKNT